MRAGTTWLTELLRSYRDCAIPPKPFKELHYFDIRYGQYSGEWHYRSKAERLRFLTRMIAERVAIALGDPTKEATPVARGTADELAGAEAEDRASTVPWTDEVRNTFFRRAGFDRELRELAETIRYFSIRDRDSYVQYLGRFSVGVRAFGEISPTYGLLPAAAFAEMDSLFPESRYIFIMRDPVQRLWSQMRFMAEKFEERHGKKRNLNRHFRHVLKRENAIGMSSYQNTIRVLESVIPRDRILYLFYEKMISPETGPAEIRRIESALGLAPARIDPGRFAINVNSSPPTRMNPENEAAAVDLLAPVYRFMRRRFEVPESWHSPGRRPNTLSAAAGRNGSRRI